MTIKYRADIDGLRAVAVIPVVLFHAGVVGFSGGFVGVDIFFVISGYLISSILLREVKTNSYSLVKFYHRRIRRIFPALFAVMLVTTFFAMWLMFPVTFHRYQNSLLSTLLFYSNYFFMLDVGYFAEHADKKPLLHMWSLAVEEQFYVVFPIYLYFVHKFFSNHALKITLFLLFASFIYSTVLLNYLPSDTFYSTPARAWELLIGTVVAILVNKKRKINYKQAQLLATLGIFCIAFAIIFFNKKIPFPGTLALFPVLGSALIIFTGSCHKTLVSHLLEHKFLVFFGLISYSLYLWHWPALVLFKTFALHQETPLSIALLLGFIVFLSYFSWKYIENPFRKKALYNSNFSLKLSLNGMILLFALAAIIGLTTMKYRRVISPEIRKLLSARSQENRPLKLTNCSRYFDKDKNTINACILGDASNNKLSFAVFGDSHADMLNAGIDTIAKKHNQKGIYTGSGGCLPLLGTHQVRQGFEVCEKMASAFMNYLIEHPEIKDIIIISRWAIYANSTRYKNTVGHDVFIKDKYTKTLSKEENALVFERSFIRTIEKLSELGRDITIIAQVPESEWSSSEMALAKTLGRDLDTRPSLADYNNRQKIVSEVFNKFKQKYKYRIIYPHKEMCDNLYCKSIDGNGVSIYTDNSHITRSYALELAPIFDKVFSKDSNPDSESQ